MQKLVNGATITVDVVDSNNNYHQYVDVVVVSNESAYIEVLDGSTTRVLLWRFVISVSV